MAQINKTVRRSIVLAACAALAVAGPIAHADISRENFTGYITLTSDYRFRGLSQTDNDPALQLGIDFQHDVGFFAGLWGSNVDFPIDQFEQNPRDIELNYYLGYQHSIGRDWAAVVSAVRYSYPDASKNYDYTEFSVGVNYRERVFASVAYSDDAFSLGGSATVYEIAAQYPLVYGTEIGGTVGLYDSADLLDGNYKYWNVGLSKPIGRWAFDVRFHDTDNTATRFFGDDVAGAGWAFSVSFVFL